MLFFSFWILVAYCVVINAYGNNNGHLENHHNHQHHNYQQHPGFSSGFPIQTHGQQATGFIQHVAEPEPQGYNYARPQPCLGSPLDKPSTTGGYGPQHSGSHGHQVQQPSTGYGFPQTSLNFHSHGFQSSNPGYESIDQARFLGNHPNAIHQHSHRPNHGQHPPFAFAGLPHSFGHHPNAIPFNPQQLPSHGAYHPNHQNPFGQLSLSTNHNQPTSTVHEEQQPSSGWDPSNAINRQPSKINLESQDESNEERGLHLATGGYGPNAIIRQHSGEDFEPEAVTGLQSATGGYGPNAINLVDREEYGIDYN